AVTERSMPGRLAPEGDGDALPEGVPRLLGQARVLADVRVERRARPELPPGLAAALAAPALVVLALLVAWPAARVAGEALLADGLPAAREQAGGGAMLGRTLLAAVVVPTVVTVVGLVLAVAAGRDRVARWCTVPVVAPVAVPLAATGVAARHLYGEGPLAGSWSTVGLLAALAWAWTGLAVVVFRAALDRVEPELTDAARAHGAAGRALGLDVLWRPVLRRTAVVVAAVVALAATRWGDLALVATAPDRRAGASTLGALAWPAEAPRGAAAGWGLVWLGLGLAGVAVAARQARRRWPPPLLLRPAPADDPVGGRRAARRAGVAVAGLVWAIPLGALVLTSLRPATPSQIASEKPTYAAFSTQFAGAYRGAVDGTDLLPSLLLTFALAAAVAVVVAALGLALAAAWSWAPLPRLARSAGLVVGVGLVALAVPAPVVAGPAADLVGVVGLDGTWVGLALVHVALLLPVAVLVLRNALAGTDLAALDHARRRGRPIREVLADRAPGAAPAALAVAVVAFVVVWGDLVVGRLFAGDDGARPVGVLLHDLAADAPASSAPLAATAVLTALVPLVVVALARRPLLDGLTAGALR
ncbi:MAG TPA: hypothetical protein VIL36_19060, partial [Acidimicrobiales bacterium]